ncbi:MAG: hypothetical protein KDE19_15485, partial [Caldilineaceae bacterium]|nr:hypothetical protein [Caldilineaceae bacterium]
MSTRLLFYLCFAMIIFYRPIAAQEQADSPFILQISASACLNEPFTRTQTGFLVKGLPGIVTTLHGVVDCAELHAGLGTSGATVIDHLYIDRVDIGQDVALLSGLGDEEQLSTNIGLELANHNVIDLAQAYTLGYLDDTPHQRQMALANVPNMQPQRLSTVVPSDMLAALSERGSPATELEVFDVGETLAPWYMGAPILDADGLVLGMVNGGLRGDPTGNSWLIPWYSIEWQPVIQAMERLGALQKQSPIDL